MMRGRTQNRGSALVLAIAVLGFVMVMGFAMFKFMDLESKELTLNLHASRAQWVANSGIEYAIAEIQTAIAAGQTDALLAESKSVDIPVYRLAGSGLDAAASAPVVDDIYKSSATVTISDECARMNVNLAPPAVLMSILKIDGEKARQMREQLPRIDGTSAGDGDRRWLASVDELVGRDLLPAESLTPERMADLTVFSAVDMQNASGYVNLNTASSAVIQAALGVTPEVADQVIAARPLHAIEALTAAAGKDANGFNFKPAADNPGALPKELAFSSRCFRITSVGQIEKSEVGKINGGGASVEAIVQFPENDAPRIVYWNEHPDGANTGN